MKFQYRIGTAIASSALMLNLLAPAAFADTTVEISGNGAGSNNTANVTNKSNTTVNQSNNMTVALNVSSKASTGKNQANNNTGGDVDVESGNATAETTVNITGGSNNATVNGCGCPSQNDTVTISGNGVDSDNTTKIKNKKKITAKQTGSLIVSGSVKSKAKTGKNKANNNTGGTVNTTSGNSNSTTTVDVWSGDNTLTLP